MPKLQISFASCPYDRLNPVMSGRVPIEGCDVNFFPLRPEELFPRVYHTQDFDVTELSASSHILTSLRGDADYLGIPAFVSRVFRHGDIYIRTDRGIRTPEDLRGRIVGVPEYQMTAALWIRGILSDEYGVKTSDIRWRNGGLQRPGRGERTPISLPPSIELQTIAADKTLSGMLADGEIDALITAVRPLCFTEKAPNVGRLFPDFRAAEEAYYRKTGMFPIMHMMGVRRSLAGSASLAPRQHPQGMPAGANHRAGRNEIDGHVLRHAAVAVGRSLPRRGRHGSEHVALWRDLQSQGARGDAALVLRAGIGAEAGDRRGSVRAGSDRSQVGHRPFPLRPADAGDECNGKRPNTLDV